MRESMDDTKGKETKKKFKKNRLLTTGRRIGVFQADTC